MRINNHNPEGYHDPTPFLAYRNIKPPTRKGRAYRPLVYICSPYADDPVNNERRAIRYCRFATRNGAIPIAPHIYFTRFLDDTNAADRSLGLFMGLVLLDKCSELWVFGDRITSGMDREIGKAERRNMIIRYFTEDMEENHA